MARTLQKYPFLASDKITDKQRRRPDHPLYDARSLYIPPDFFRRNKITDAQQQWWEIKAENFDSVLMFKMGKFYEVGQMFNMGLVYVAGKFCSEWEFN